MDIRLCPDCGRGEAPPAVACSQCGQPLQLRDERWLIGQTLGNYRIERILGSGGMGVVFGARHQTLLREAAIKVLQPGLGSNTGSNTGSAQPDAESSGEAFARRFQREARLLAALEHPAIVGIYDFDVSPYGFPFLVMPLLRGETLRALLDRHPGGVPPAFVSAIAEDLAAGLAHAHAQGIVHRDLKPENLFLSLEGGGVRARLLDFGIAHGGLRDALDRTATGVMMGTPMYLAPEQMRGDAVSPATDQYSAALLVAELLSGHAARAGMSLTGILRRDGHVPLPPEALPPRIDAQLAAALTRATQPVPAERFPDMAAFAAALRLPPPDRAGLASAIVDASRPRRAETQLAQGSSPGTMVLPAPSAMTQAMSSAVSPSQGGASGKPSQRPSRRAPSWFAPAALALLALALFAVWQLRTSPDRDSARQAAAAPQPATGDWLRERDRHTLPGALGVLARQETTLILRQAGGFSLFDTNTASAAPGVALASGERLVGADENGSLWLLLRDGGLDALSPGRGQRRHVVAASHALANAPADAHWSLARSGRWLARIDATGARIFRLEENGATPWFDAPAGAGTRIALGDRIAILATPRQTLHAFDLETRAERWREPLAAFRANDLAFDEALDRLALATEDGVLVRNASDGKRASALPGNAASVLWFADGPRLLVGDGRELNLWRANEDGYEREQRLVGGALWLFRDGGELLAGNEAGFRRLGFGHAPEPIDTGVGQVWAIAADDSRFYLGGEPLQRQVHAAGIPDLRIHDGHLVSASDDKTLAVWKLPELELQWRARGHEFLVNQIALGASPWSASSDGQLRRWRWPELSAADAIDLRARLDPALELHALWVSPDDAEILAGTWNNRLLRLSRDNGNWIVASAPFEAHVGYRMVDLVALDAVLAVGLEPGRLAIHDRRDGALHDLPRSVGQWHAACADGNGDGVWLGNDGAVAHLAVARREEGGFEISMRTIQSSGFGAVGAIAVLPANGGRGALLGVGGDGGELRLLPLPAENGAAPVRFVSENARAFQSIPP